MSAGNGPINGPWTFSPAEGGMILDKSGAPVCQVSQFGVSDNWLSNASLIAIAPTMRLLLYGGLAIVGRSPMAPKTEDWRKDTLGMLALVHAHGMQP